MESQIAVSISGIHNGQIDGEFYQAIVPKSPSTFESVVKLSLLKRYDECILFRSDDRPALVSVAMGLPQPWRLGDYGYDYIITVAHPSNSQGKHKRKNDNRLDLGTTNLMTPILIALPVLPMYPIPIQLLSAASVFRYLSLTMSGNLDEQESQAQTEMETNSLLAACFNKAPSVLLLWLPRAEKLSDEVRQQATEAAATTAAAIYDAGYEMWKDWFGSDSVVTTRDHV